MSKKLLLLLFENPELFFSCCVSGLNMVYVMGNVKRNLKAATEVPMLEDFTAEQFDDMIQDMFETIG